MVECPSCGLKLLSQSIEPPLGYRASSECYRKFRELTFYTLSKQDTDFLHQHAIEAYAAQHYGREMKSITITFALIGLYFAVDHHYSGRQVQRVHMLLGRQKHQWEAHNLPLYPSSSYSLTAGDVLQEQPGEHRDAVLRAWMGAVWQCWKDQHDWVKGVCHTLLP
ncbi:MAG: DUF5946 family protein [Chloroflexi bacterium]|nr:DUF5946 family protein [Chloroflexota bacterium]